MKYYSLCFLFILALTSCRGGSAGDLGSSSQEGSAGLAIVPDPALKPFYEEKMQDSQQAFLTVVDRLKRDGDKLQDEEYRTVIQSIHDLMNLEPEGAMVQPGVHDSEIYDPNEVGPPFRLKKIEAWAFCPADYYLEAMSFKVGLATYLVYASPARPYLSGSKEDISGFKPQYSTEFDLSYRYAFSQLYVQPPVNCPYGIRNRIHHLSYSQRTKNAVESLRKSLDTETKRLWQLNKGPLKGSELAAELEVLERNVLAAYEALP